MSEPIIFTGPTQFSQKLFNKYYVPQILKAIADKRTIRVGCARDGCDEFVQVFCMKSSYNNVEVYVPSEEDEAKVYYATTAFNRIVVEGGFKKRDRAMWKDCKEAFAHLSQYAGAASGAAANLIAMAARAGKFGPDCIELDGYAVVDILRKAGATFQPELQKIVLAAEEASEK